MSYLGRSAKLSLKAQEKVSFLATAGQTEKTGLSYTVGFIEVYVNGVLLTDTTDFTATNGSSVTFTVALLLNDEVTVISLKTFSVADHYTKSDADTLLAAKATNTAVALKAPIASPVFTGNVGIGVNPASGWHSNHVALQLGGGKDGFISSPIGQNIGRMFVGSNCHSTTNDGATGGTGWVRNGDTYRPSLMAMQNGNISFLTAAAGSGGISWNTAMTIDNAGRVTKPNQPAFRVSNAGGGDYTTIGYMTFGNAMLNTGTHYSTSTGKFTAPIAGRYYLAFRALTRSASHTNMWVGINVNGTALTQTYHTHTNHSNISAESIVSLSANDYVQVYLGGGGLHSGSGHDKYTFFQGYLLG